MRLTLMRSAAASACFVDAFVVSRQKNPEIIKKSLTTECNSSKFKNKFLGCKK